MTDFLSHTSIIDSPLTFQPKEFDNMSYPMSDFYKAISEHTGLFIVNGISYTSLIPSINNLYFFIKESVNVEYLLSFNAIIDIKQKKLNEFIVFYYPDSKVTILLQDFNNVKENKTTT